LRLAFFSHIFGNSHTNLNFLSIFNFNITGSLGKAKWGEKLVFFLTNRPPLIVNYTSIFSSHSLPNNALRCTNCFSNK
jgi:hypothetical protein